jgi:hypothetical protein
MNSKDKKPEHILSRLEACFDPEHYTPEVSDVFVSAQLIRDACAAIQSLEAEAFSLRAELCSSDTYQKCQSLIKKRDELQAEVQRLQRRATELAIAKRIHETANAGHIKDIDEMKAEVKRLRDELLTVKGDGEWKETAVNLAEENGKLVAEVEQLRERAKRAEAERDNWINSAEQHLRNEEFYRDIVCRIGDTYGEEARTSDDGIVHEDVLVLKVLELATQPKYPVEAERIAELEDARKADFEDLQEAEKEVRRLKEWLNLIRVDSIAETTRKQVQQALNGDVVDDHYQMEEEG